jgi:hypothetical protein
MVPEALLIAGFFGGHEVLLPATKRLLQVGRRWPTHYGKLVDGLRDVC